MKEVATAKAIGVSGGTRGKLSEEWRGGQVKGEKAESRKQRAGTARVQEAGFRNYSEPSSC
jgi:hypothetical protein